MAHSLRSALRKPPQLLCFAAKWPSQRRAARAQGRAGLDGAHILSEPLPVRFRELRLLAFGHFTGRVLNFAAKPLAVQLIYGHNEAGKSTALRAVHGLLYGIPQLSADTFLHGGPELRLGALLEDEHSRTLEIVRRKGKKNTLLDKNGEALDEKSALGPLLGAVDETLFQSMFGLDHERLRLGARDLLSGAGNLSESLFGASRGGGHTHRLLSSLRDQAEELFTSRGRGRKRINQEIADAREAHRDVAANSTTAQSYREREQQLAEVSQEVERLKRDRARLNAQKSRLARLLRTLPRVAKLQALSAARLDLGPLPTLPDAVEEWRLDALGTLEETQRQAAFLQAEIARHEQLLASINVSEALAELDAHTIEALSQSLGQFHKARIDLPKRQGEHRKAEQETLDVLRALQRDVSLEQADGLRLSKPEEQHVRRLCAEKVRLDATLSEREVSYKESQRQAAQRQRELTRAPVPRDGGPLRAALERTRAQVDLEERLDAERRRAAQLERALGERLLAVGRLRQGTERLLELALPTRETLLRFERDFLKGGEQLERTLEKSSEARRAVAEQQRELLLLESQGEVPSEAILRGLREERDQALRALREQARRAEAMNTATLSAELDRALDGNQAADQYADRLRFEAERVTKKAALQASLSAHSAELAVQEAQQATQRSALAQLDQAWQALWQPLQVEPLPPREMVEWLGRVFELQKQAEQLQTSQTEVRRLEGRVALLEKDLSAALEQLGEPTRTLWENLGQLVERAQRTLGQLENSQREYREAEQRHVLALEEEGDHQRRLLELRETQKQFRTEFGKALKLLQLDKDASAADVIEALDRRAELFHKLKETQELDRRIKGILRDEETLGNTVRELVRRAAPELENLPLAEAAERLLRSHKKAALDSRERLRLKLELERQQAELRKVQREEQTARERLAELLRLAGVNNKDELLLVEKKVREAAALLRQEEEEKSEIIAAGEGESLADLVAAAEQTSADELREQAGQVEAELSQLDEKLEGLVQSRTTAENQLRALGAGAFAAAEELALRTAKLRNSVQQYLKLRLASAILGAEVERYREEHQGPLLRRASELFPRLTLGAYSGLKVGFNKNDEQILLCVTKDGAEKRVEVLSDGTRDQLYLSLRLATVQHYMERTNGMPLVLDDILIHFDDERARAALAVLGEVATETQVLFFTHHQRLVELAHQAIPEASLNVLQLGAEPAA